MLESTSYLCVNWKLLKDVCFDLSTINRLHTGTVTHTNHSARNTCHAAPHSLFNIRSPLYVEAPASISILRQTVQTATYCICTNGIDDLIQRAAASWTLKR